MTFLLLSECTFGSLYADKYVEILYIGLCTFISLIFALILMLSDTLSNLCPEFNPEAPKDGIPGQSDRLQVD